MLIGIGVWLTQGGLTIPQLTPPLYWVGIAFIVVGVGIVIFGVAKKPLQYQQEFKITDIISEMHNLRTSYAEKKVENDPIDTSSIEKQYMELLGIDASDPFSILLSMLTALKGRTTDDVELQASLVHAGRLMDRYKMGIDTLTSDDARYRKLKKEYGRWYRHNKDPEIRKAVYNYLLESYGMNSQWLYIASKMKRTPKSILQMLPELMKTYIDGYKEYMNMYLGKWIDTTNESLGKSNGDN